MSGRRSPKPMPGGRKILNRRTPVGPTATPASQSPVPIGGFRLATATFSALFMKRVPVRVDSRFSVKRLRARRLVQEDERLTFAAVHVLRRRARPLPFPSFRGTGARHCVGPKGEHVACGLVDSNRRLPLRFGSDSAAGATGHRVRAAEPHAEKRVLLEPGIRHVRHREVCWR